MEDKSTLEKLKEPFKLTIIKDSAPDNNFCYGFLVFLFAGSPFPTPILQEKRVICTYLAWNSVGCGRVEGHQVY